MVFSSGRYIYDDSGRLEDCKKEEEGYKAIWKDDDQKYAYVTLVRIVQTCLFLWLQTIIFC